MQDLIKYQSEVKSISTVNTKTGATTVRLLRAKEFKDDYKKANPTATNKEVKAAFLAYYQPACRANVASLAGKLTEGTLGVESYRVNADGDKMSVTFVDLSAVKEEKVDYSPEELEKLPVETLAKMLDFIHKKLGTGAGLPE